MLRVEEFLFIGDNFKSMGDDNSAFFELFIKLWQEFYDKLGHKKNIKIVGI
jgi:hypothetical protein